MLQLSTARNRPPPPVTDMPPPPPMTGENEVGNGRDNPADATVPIDGMQVKATLSRPTRPEQRAVGLPPPPPDPREDTEIIDSGQFFQEEAKSQQAEAGTQESRIGNRTTIWLAVLTLAGLVLGAGGGYVLMQQMRSGQSAAEKGPDVVSPEKLDAQKWAAEKAEREKAAVEAQRLAEQKAQEEKAATERALADKQATEAAQTAAVEKAAGEKAAADNSGDKAAHEKMISEKIASVEKAKAEKLAAEKEAADKGATEKAAADKAAADKASAEKKKGTDVAAASVGAAGSDGSCADGMRPVAAGSFKMGTAKDDEMLNFDEKSLESVDVSAFCVDLFEFPNKRGVTPTVNVSWSDAKRLCEGRGKRLCSESEWEKACKGPGNARWPYGSTFDANACNTEDDVGDDRTIAPSGRFAKCRSGYGVADLSGNIAEWTLERQQKGGSFSKPDYAVRCSARKAVTSGAKAADVGFRCCTDLKQ
jgi:formylglycine-generating enzyme required for sulfatase activity